jgi:hypothetical protein
MQVHFPINKDQYEGIFFRALEEELRKRGRALKQYSSEEAAVMAKFKAVRPEPEARELFLNWKMEKQGGCLMIEDILGTGRRKWIVDELVGVQLAPVLVKSAPAPAIEVSSVPVGFEGEFEAIAELDIQDSHTSVSTVILNGHADREFTIAAGECFTLQGRGRASFVRIGPQATMAGLVVQVASHGYKRIGGRQPRGYQGRSKDDMLCWGSRGWEFSDTYHVYSQSNFCFDERDFFAAVSMEEEGDLKVQDVIDRVSHSVAVPGPYYAYSKTGKVGGGLLLKKTFSIIVVAREEISFPHWEESGEVKDQVLVYCPDFVTSFFGIALGWKAKVPLHFKRAPPHMYTIYDGCRKIESTLPIVALHCGRVERRSGICLEYTDRHCTHEDCQCRITVKVPLHGIEVSAPVGTWERQLTWLASWFFRNGWKYTVEERDVSVIIPAPKNLVEVVKWFNRFAFCGGLGKRPSTSLLATFSSELELEAMLCWDISLLGDFCPFRFFSRTREWEPETVLLKSSLSLSLAGMLVIFSTVTRDDERMLYGVCRGEGHLVTVFPNPLLAFRAKCYLEERGIDFMAPVDFFRTK